MWAVGGSIPLSSVMSQTSLCHVSIPCSYFKIFVILVFFHIAVPVITQVGGVNLISI